MSRKIFFYPERCILCHSCILACEMQSLGISDFQEIPYNKLPSKRIRLSLFEGTPWVWKCQQCSSPPCVEACVSGSMTLDDENGIVIHKKEKCIGCKSCILVCPYGSLYYDESKKKVDKCNLCQEEKIPPCVKACDTNALVFEETEHFLWKKRKKFILHLRWLCESM